MKYTKKFLALLLALILSVGILAACAQQETGDTNPTNTVSQAISASSSEDITEELSFSEEDILVTIDAAFNDKIYTMGDFADVNCVELEELTVGEIKPHHICRIFYIRIGNPSKENVKNAVEILKKREDIHSAELCYPIPLDSDFSFASTPNDSYASSEYQWAINRLSLPSVWSTTTGSSSIRVGVIDSGIDGTHPDLTNRVDRTLSKSFHSDYSTALEDATGHGTHVAGIIGAQGNNNLGITGTCWNVKLVSLRAVDKSGDLNPVAILKAIQYADSQGIPILNFSGGTTVYNADTKAIEAAIKSYDGLFVCAAGNESKNNDSSPTYPANHKFTNLISVGASTESDKKRSSSNYGATKVDLFAPGDSIISCIPTAFCTSGICANATHVANGYHYSGGTSMAAPYVAGVAALLLSKYPSMTVHQLKEEILNNTTKITELQNLCLTGGRLNAYRIFSNISCVHNYTNYYTSVSSTGHNAYCSCGAYISQIHTFTSSGSTLVCSKCGYSSISLNNQGLEVEMQ